MEGKKMRFLNGLLWDYNPNAPFIYGAVLSLLAGITICEPLIKLT
ncbi:MAG: hypothetical protein ABH870_00305 [bacterium]